LASYTRVDHASGVYYEDGGSGGADKIRILFWITERSEKRINVRMGNEYKIDSEISSYNSAASIYMDKLMISIFIYD